MTRAPIIAEGTAIAATGGTFALHEWSPGPGDGPPLHVHYSDDEAWYVLEGTLRFGFSGRTVDVRAGTAVFVPAGVAHTFGNPGPNSVRYLTVATRRILDVVEALHALDKSAMDELAAVYRRYDSELVEYMPSR